MSARATHYEVLGIARDATADDVRAAFRRLAYLHPDQHPGDPTAIARFARITEAYAVLSDGDARAKYDACGPSLGGGPVSETIDLVAEIAREAQGIDPAVVGIRVLDKLATSDGRRDVKSLWAALRGIIT